MKKTVFVNLIVTLLAALLIISCQTAKPSPDIEKKPELSEGQRIEKSRDLLLQAQAKLSEGKNGEGLDLLNTALELDPDNGDAYLEKGRAYQNLGKVEKAIEIFTEYPKKFSRQVPRAMTHLAICYRDLGDKEKYKDQILATVQKFPNDSWANQTLAEYYLYEEDNATLSIKYFDISIKANKNPWSLLNRGRAFIRLGDKAKALADFTSAKALIDNGQGDKWVTGEVAKELARLEP